MSKVRCLGKCIRVYLREKPRFNVAFLIFGIVFFHLDKFFGKVSKIESFLNIPVYNHYQIHKRFLYE